MGGNGAMTRRRLSLAIGAALALAAAGPARAKVFPRLTPAGLPNVQSAAAFVFDFDTGETLFSKSPDAVRQIASTGKIFVAMTVRRLGLKLDGTTTISKVDAHFARGGARSRLRVGLTFANRDILKAMLIASDNRAPTALGRAVGLSPAELVAQMNEQARLLGLHHTHFTDPSGINGNESTAREMSVAFRAVLKDPLLAEIMSTKTARVESLPPRRRIIQYRNTNHVLHRPSDHVFAGKTGYTDAAGYCLLVGANIAGHRVGMVFLGEQGKLTRYGDFGRVASWVPDAAALRATRVAGKAAGGRTATARMP